MVTLFQVFLSTYIRYVHEELVLHIGLRYFAVVGHSCSFFHCMHRIHTQLAIVYSYYHVLSCSVEFNHPIY